MSSLVSEDKKALKKVANLMEPENSSKLPINDTSPSSFVYENMMLLNVELDSLSEYQFTRMCEKFQTCLDALVSKGMSEVYGTASQFFKSFKAMFVKSKKLKNKMFQLEGEKRMMANKRAGLLLQVSDRDEKIKYLQECLLTLKSTKEQMEETKVKLVNQLKEWKDFYDAEKTKEKDSDLLSEEARKNLRDRYNDAMEEISLLKQDLSFSKEREENFQDRALLAENVKKELFQEIQCGKRELERAALEREKLESVIVEKDKEIQSDLEFIESLREDVRKLNLNVQSSNEKAKSIGDKLKSCQKQLGDSKQTIGTLNKNLLVRQFHVTVLRSEKNKLKEFLIDDKKEEILTLQTQLNKTSSWKNDLAHKVQILESKVEELNAEVESCHKTIKWQQEELNVQQKKETTKVEIVETLKKDIAKLNIELHSSNKLLHERTIRLKAQQRSSLYVRRELDTRLRAIKELESKIKFIEIEKENRSKEARLLTDAISELQDNVKVLEQKDLETESEKLKLKREIQQEKDQTRLYQNGERQARKQAKNLQLRLEEVANLQRAINTSTENSNDRIHELDVQVGSLEKRITFLNNRNKSIACSLKEKEKTNVYLMSEVDCKSKELNNVLKSTKLKEQELDFLKNKIQRLVDEKRTTSLKISDMTTEMDTKVRRIEFLEADVAKIQQILRQREEEIKILSIEIEHLRHSQSLTKRQVQSTGFHEREIYLLKKLYEDEKLKCKALEEEIQKSKKHYRWRSFGSGEPSMPTLLMKNTRLQKELARKADTLRDMENELKNKGNEIESLRADMKRRSESHTDEKLWTCQKDLESSRSKIKTLLGERWASESLCSKYEKEIEVLKLELRKCSI